ncbi:(2Fe-2S)-binding protein [Cupriavidus necator]|uniref:(2Fe-2S)-binding protein n=1 Tax=Cupriavidus necator TaxID=106590 RepID=UPI0039C2B2C8
METEANLITLSLELNGQPHRCDIEPGSSLADCLRDSLRMTSVHLGCEHGVCGACNVIVDGKVVRSCLTLAAGCEGSAVTTLEGLADAPAQAMKQAFRRHHALQCGFCTPGMMVTACAMQAEAAEWCQRSEDEVRSHLAGNVCRCTGYQGIVAAVREGLAAVTDSVPEVTA